MEPGAVEKPDNNRQNDKPISDGQKCLVFGVISVVSCAAFAGSGTLIGIGYQNPGSIALGILAIGTVLFFATIISMVACCIWVDRKYPEEQPLPVPGRVRRSADVESVPLLNPSASVGSSLLPPKDIIIPHRPVKPASQSDHTDSIPKSSHVGDFSTTTCTSKVSNGKSVPDLKLEPLSIDLTPRTVRSKNINVTPSDDPPVDVRIVSQPKKNQSHQENMTISQRPENLSTGSAGDLPADTKSVSHHRSHEVQTKECLATPGSADITSTRSDDSPPTDVRIVSHQKWEKPCEMKNFGYPIPGKVTSVQASGPSFDVRIVSGHRKGLYNHDEILKTPSSKDLVATPIMALPVNVKPTTHQEEVLRPQKKSAASPDSGRIITTAVGSSTINTEPVSNSTLNPSKQFKHPSVPPAPEATDLSRHSHLKPVSHQTPVQHSQDVPKKDPFPADITHMTKTVGLKQSKFAPDQKVDEHRAFNALRVTSTGYGVKTAAEDISKSSRPVPPLKKGCHISPTGARFQKTVPGGGDLTDCKASRTTNRQDGGQQDS